MCVSHPAHASPPCGERFIRPLPVSRQEHRFLGTNRLFAVPSLPNKAGKEETGSPPGSAGALRNFLSCRLEPGRRRTRPTHEPYSLTMQTTSDEVLIARIAGGDRL